MKAGILSQRLTFNRPAFRLQHLFATPVAVAPVNDSAALNEALLEIILARCAEKPGVARSNAGGWQSRDDFVGWAGEPGQALVAAARALVDQLTRVQLEDELLPQAPEWTINAWANVNGPGDSNRAHHHPGAFWSGVYWVTTGIEAGDDDTGGEFEMLDPRGVLPAFCAPSLRYAVPGCLSAGMSEFFKPVAGTLILFPSWLVHAVRPYGGSSRRVSVAFNFAAA